MARWYIIYFLVLFWDRTSASYKRWLPDTNFDNPNNWNLKRTPCGNDVTTIPDESPVVYVQLNTTIRELNLPKDGELILGRDMAIGFTDRPVEGCVDLGGDLEFTAVNPESWLNPKNWCKAPTERGACDVQFSLDVEKVPCVYDDVIFPRDHSYFVDLSEDTPILSTKSLKISGTTFQTPTFTSFVNSAEGEKMFRKANRQVGRDLINITRRSCDDMRGCACGNDRPEFAKVICSHVEKTCRRPRCVKTIQPVGACCRICGAVFNVTRGYGFKFDEFTSTLQPFVTGQDQGVVNMTVSLTRDGWVQVVLTDLTGVKSASVAKEIKSEFDQDIAAGGLVYAIDAYHLSLGDDRSQVEALTGVQLSGGSIAGIVIGILVLIFVLVVIVIIIVFRRTGRKIPLPNLPICPRRTSKGGTRLHSGAQSVPRTAPHIDPGFANPLYDSSPFDDGNVSKKEMELVVSSVEEQPTFDVSERGFYNPLFGTTGPSMFSDPAEAKDAEGGSTSTTPTTSSPRASGTIVTIEDPSSDSTI